jgi:hypothetical protein
MIISKYLFFNNYLNLNIFNNYINLNLFFSFIFNLFFSDIKPYFVLSNKFFKNQLFINDYINLSLKKKN